MEGMNERSLPPSSGKPRVANDFAIDDFYLIVENPAIHSLSRVPALFREPWGNGSGEEPMYTRVNAAAFRPISSAFQALEYAAFGARPAPFHAVSAILH